MPGGKLREWPRDGAEMIRRGGGDEMTDDRVIQRDQGTWGLQWEENTASNSVS